MAEQSPTETFPPRTRAELRTLTAIRGLGALYVMLFHAYFFFVTAGKAPTDAAAAMDGDRWVFRLPFVGHGYLGVELFFILSGYVMYYVYADIFASAPSGRLSAFRSFMFHRVARIYPLHAVVLTAVLVLKLLAARHAPALASSNPDAPDPATTLLNYLLLQRIIPCPSIIIPAWSLSVEMFSYALFPLMLALLVSGGVATAVAAAALAVAALSIVQAYSNGILHNFTEGYFPLLRGVAGFALGMAAFRLSQPARVRRILRHPALLPALLAVTLLLLVIPSDDRLTVAAFVLLIMILGQQTSFGVRVFCNRFLLWVGGISYSVYLIHMPAAALMARLDAAVFRAIPAAWTAALPPTGIFLVEYMVLGAVVLPVAALTCRWIELPARRALRHVLDQRLPIPSLR